MLDTKLNKANLIKFRYIFLKSNKVVNEIILKYILLKFLNLLTKDGNKVLADRIVKNLFLRIKLEGYNPLIFFYKSVQSVKPFCLIKVKKMGHKKKRIIQQPLFLIDDKKRLNLALKNIIKYSKSQKSNNIHDRLFLELQGCLNGDSFSKKHQKEIGEDNITYFTFGGRLIEDILDPDSDLNTTRLEHKDLEDELKNVIGTKKLSNSILKNFNQRLIKFFPNFFS